MGTIWIGVDVGKTHYHVAAVDDAGKLVLSEQVASDQKAISAIVAQVGRRRGQLCWGVDLRTGPAALLLAVLLGKGADVRYVCGSVTSRMAEEFHGEHKTDAKDAVVIAQTLRMRSDLPRITMTDAVQTELKLLTARSIDLVDERVRTILRLQDLLGMVSPAVARVLDLTKKGPVRLLAKWQTPAAIRRAGPVRIAAELRAHRITNAAALADKVVTAARTQAVAVAGEATAALIIEQLAADLQAFDDRIAVVEDLIEAALARHELAEVVTSLPGMGTVLAAEFIAHVGTLDGYRSPAALAAHAGLAPVARDSGRVQGHQRRPHRYHRGLRAGSSASPPSARCAPAQPPGPTTTENAPRERPTARPPRPCLDVASTCSGPASATTRPTAQTVTIGSARRSVSKPRNSRS